MHEQPFPFALANQTGKTPAFFVEQLAKLLEARQWLLATAESCTGGGVAAACTDRAGSSAWFAGGIISYSNNTKEQLLGVPRTILTRVGAVSAECAAAMASGAQQRLASNLAISTTGIAGPSGGSAEKPVGMVCFGLACGEKVYTDIQYFAGDRQQVRALTVQHALVMLVSYLNEN